MTFLDVESRTQLRHLMKDWFSTYVGVVVLISHDDADIAELVDAVYRVGVTRDVATKATLSDR